MNIIRFFLSSIILVSLLGACSASKNVAYFQDASSQNSVQLQRPEAIKLRPKDKISVIVNCKDPQLTALFNLPYVSQRIGTTSGTLLATTNDKVSGYTIDENGEIDFPVIGKVKVEGLTRSQVAEKIRHEIEAQNQAKDPVVTVDYMNLSISIMGEVTRPGRYYIEKDEVTILEALSMAGDLNIQGKRRNVMLLRKENGEEKSYSVDLCSISQTVSSPAYYIQPDDVIYVEPTRMRKRQSTVNGNNLVSTSFWISVSSLVATVTSIVLSNKK